MSAGYAINEVPAVIAKNESEIDSPETSSTDGGLSDDTPSVVQRLVEIPKKQGIKNIKKVLEKDMLNRYQAKQPELNFLLQCEREFAKYVGMKYAVSLNSGGIAISLVCRVSSASSSPMINLRISGFTPMLLHSMRCHLRVWWQDSVIPCN
jgi:hypothetical protein